MSDETDDVTIQSVGGSLPPTTTLQEDKTTEGQRRVNLIWEFTQASIAVGITGAVIYASVLEIESQVLNSGFFLIIGFYFSRTNHQAIGGIGNKANIGPKYQGR